jgi:putative transposase
VVYNYAMAQYTIHYQVKDHVTYFCQYHIAWCPQYRRPVLIDGADTRLKEIIQSVCQTFGAEIRHLEITADHVQLIVEVDPHYGVHRLMRQIKGRSSRLLRNEFPWLRSRLSTLWTNSYFVSTVGNVPPEVIEQYMDQQKWVKRSLRKKKQTSS